MPFPKKFKKLIEITSQDIDLPNFAWLTYAVCACEKDSCGWQGWIIDAVFGTKEGKDVILPSISSENCPVCDKPLFRTEVELKVEPSDNQQATITPGVDYEVSDIVYDEDDKSTL